MEYVDFKQRLHNLFPVIVDTKNVCFGLRKVGKEFVTNEYNGKMLCTG